MGGRTVTNDTYQGLVEEKVIPVSLHTEQDGRVTASYRDIRPIHTCSPDEISTRSASTLQYCGIFTTEPLASPEELVYVRIDDSHAEKVFINRSKRVVLHSSDGRVAQWLCAPTFESTNKFVSGTPIVTREGSLVSVVTARVGNHYAVSCSEGEGGYFETSKPWTVLETSSRPHLIYGDRVFVRRAQLQEHVAILPPAYIGEDAQPTPVLVLGGNAAVSLVASNGRQVSLARLPQGVAGPAVYL